MISFSFDRRALRLALSLTALGFATACSDVGKGFKGGVDWVRDAFNQPVARIPADGASGPFPDIPNDQRPTLHTTRQETDLIKELDADKNTAGKIGAALAKNDRTRYIAFNGAPPAAGPIALQPETVKLADGVRDLDSIDPHRRVTWMRLATIDFAEGSAETPEDAARSLTAAARLSKGDGLLRVVGYSASERVRLADKGAHEANRYLADLRARKVAELLLAAGTPPGKIAAGAAQESERNGGDKVEIIIDY